MLSKLLGLLIIIAFFVGLVLFVSSAVGILKAFAIIGVSIGLTAILMLGIILLIK